jgi:hypothetical protein
MSPIDHRIREAWKSGDGTALDRVVEELAWEGHDESSISESLERLLLAARDQGADDATEDRILDVMDRLTGWCHESRQIRTATISLPSETDVTELPRWARVAFACRCARRVLPLFDLHRHQDAISFQKLDLPESLELAEYSAGIAESPADPNMAYSESASFSYSPDDLRSIVANAVANSVAYAAADAGDNNRPIRAYIAMCFANEASKFFASINSHIQADFRHLMHLADTQHWTDDTPVPREVFGPLWPAGLPTGWPVVKVSHQLECDPAAVPLSGGTQ